MKGGCQENKKQEERKKKSKQESKKENGWLEGLGTPALEELCNGKAYEGVEEHRHEISDDNMWTVSSKPAVYSVTS